MEVIINHKDVFNIYDTYEQKPCLEHGVSANEIKAYFKEDGKKGLELPTS